MSPLEAALSGIWLMLPALVPNSAAVLFGGGTPMDFGRSWNGKRLLGDGKTWRGFFGGAMTGVFLGLLLIGLSELAGEEATWGYGSFPQSVVVVGCLAFGSMVGDSVGSFLKRRLGLERGGKAPVLDQYNFVAGAVVFVLLGDNQWFFEHYIDGNAIWGLVAFLVVVPVLHRGVNIIGYRIGRKDVPW